MIYKQSYDLKKETFEIFMKQTNNLHVNSNSTVQVHVLLYLLPYIL